MEAPDKIYVTPVGTWDTQHIPDLQDSIYIRKDALLEWAKGEIMPGNSAEGKGWNWAIQTLIDKIESL